MSKVFTTCALMVMVLLTSSTFSLAQGSSAEVTTESAVQVLRFDITNLIDETDGGKTSFAPAKSRFIKYKDGESETYRFVFIADIKNKPDNLIQANHRYSGTLKQSDYEPYNSSTEITTSPVAVPFKISLARGGNTGPGGSIGYCLTIGRRTSYGTGAFLIGTGAAIDGAGNGSSGTSTGISGFAGMTFAPVKSGQIGIILGYDHGVSGPLNDKFWLSVSFSGFSSPKFETPPKSGTS